MLKNTDIITPKTIAVGRFIRVYSLTVVFEGLKRRKRIPASTAKATTVQMLKADAPTVISREV